MARRKAPRIPDALLDQLLAGADPKTAFDANGLLDDLKKALAERALNAEMDHHLAGDEVGNSRNGYGRKTVTTETGRIELEIPRDRQASFYGYRKLHDDLLDQGETSCANRIARLARLAGIKAQIGYRRRPGSHGGKPAVVVDNTLARRFDVDAQDKAWVTDITYIRTQEGFAYLAGVIDLFSRRVIGWSLQSRQVTDVVLQALLMAVWRRKPKTTVLVHSDQGSQFTSMDWAAFLKHHNLEHSMSRRGNCHDNAVAESFFNLLKRERIRRKIYRTREEARQDVFDYIEMFYNPRRKHFRNGMLSPVEFERQHNS
ncbi:MAG: IS3 family transposase [Proteobacteria bacterium]|nr:IS3 family transposase [Pseudomonadota bacterium]